MDDRAEPVERVELRGRRCRSPPKELGHSTISVTSDLNGHLFEKASKQMTRNAAKLVPRAKRKPGRRTA